MLSHKTLHTIENIKREISAILHELKDPRMHDGFVSIAKIDVSEDKSSCKVFISALEGIEKAKQAAGVLKSAEGHIRKELGQRLRLKYVPNLRFQATDAVEHGFDLAKKIEEISSSKEDINDT